MCWAFASLLLKPCVFVTTACFTGSSQPSRCKMARTRHRKRAQERLRAAIRDT